MNPPVLQIKNLRVLFPNYENFSSGPVCAVQGANLEVPEGLFTALVGGSGSGKSVTALSICRLVTALSISGEIYFSSPGFGRQNLLQMKTSDLVQIRGKEISYIFQDPSSSFNPVMKIGVQIDEVRLAHSDVSKAEAKARTMELLESVSLKDCGRIYGSFAHELSGGMKQRAMIAMALSSNPKLLIADEPTTALDVMTEMEILKLLAGLQKDRSLTVLFITHDLSLAAQYAERIFVMEKGLVIEGMEKQNGRFSPNHAYTKRLFKAHLGFGAPKTLIEVE